MRAEKSQGRRNESGDKLANYLTMTGHACSDINQGALSAILPFLVVGSGYSYFEATMLVLAANLASAVIQPLFGWLGDKHRLCGRIWLGAGVGYGKRHRSGDVSS